MGDLIELPPGAKAIPGPRLEIMQREVAKIIEQLLAMHSELNAIPPTSGDHLELPDMAIGVRTDLIASAIQDLQNFQVSEEQLRKELSDGMRSVEP